MKKLILNTLIFVVLVVCFSCTVYQVNTSRMETKDPTKQATICQVHGLPLEVVIVPIRYGFTIFPKGYYEASKEFPNAANPIEGGCFYHPSFNEFGEKAACPKCTDLWMKWEKLHGV